MRNPGLKLMDLVFGLEYFESKDRYTSFNVFADDVLETWAYGPVKGLEALDHAGLRFRFTVPEGNVHAGERYDLVILPEWGILRASRATPHDVADPASSAPGGLSGEQAEIARLEAQRRRGEGASESPILGLLVGTTLKGSAMLDAPRHVFTLRFDGSVGQWKAYDGGLVPWMKENLLARSA
jgi:hypothetical protein